MRWGTAFFFKDGGGFLTKGPSVKPSRDMTFLKPQIMAF